MQIDVSRDPVDDTQVQTTLSGKELRTTWSTYPRYRYSVSFELLRSGASLREFQQFFTHLARHRGMLDSFLFTDPEDNVVADHGFAVGDGVTTAFPLQRTLQGDILDAAGFTYKAQSKPYSNLIKNSSFEASSAGLATSWSVYNQDAAFGNTEPAVSTIVPGRNGGSAQRISWGTSNTRTKGLQQPGTGTKLAGQWYTLAFFARHFGNVAGAMTPNWNSFPSTTTIIANPLLSSSWQLYIFQIRWNVGATVDPDLFLTIAVSAAGFGDLDIDETILVAGQFDATTLPQPFATPAAAAATDNPSYWPALGDGFEPIFDLSAPPTIYQDGDWGKGSGPGKRTLYPFTRSNLLPFSEQFDNAAWSKTGLTVTANTTLAPDGTTTAETISEGVANSQHFTNETTSPAAGQGELRCYSVFVKANNLPNIQFAENFTGINFNLGTGAIDSVIGVLTSGVITDPRWPGWFRIWFTTRIAAADIGSGFLFCTPAGGSYSTAAYLGTSRTFFAWGAMCERTSNLLGPTPYIATPSSASVTVTDYSIDSLGKVTPAIVLPVGAFLSADLTYFRRVRFDTDSVPAERIVTSFWKTGRVPLVSVK